MWFEILKKDLMKQKSVNIILFLFITLSTIFLASSVSNIRVVTNGLKMYMDYANVSDVMVVLSREDEREEFEDWIKSCGEITEYAYEQLCQVKADDIVPRKAGENQGQTSPFEAAVTNLYLGYTGGKYAKPLDGEGNDIALKPGEVALPPGLMERNGLQIGDTIQIKISDKTFDYWIAVQSKDILFGNEMSGVARLVFCREDYDTMLRDFANETTGVFGFNATEPEKAVELMNEQGFQSIAITADRNLYSMLYVFDMVIAALLIVIGICLILISLMILRFSLSFTMEENYREIGVMKAIGMRDFSIQKIYLVKYFAVVATGAAVGILLSIPVGALMTESVSRNMVLGGSTNSLWINLVCGVAIIIFVAGMCVLFTRKLRKVSATVSFLGLNDILCNTKRYLVLLFTFCISFVMITVPLNTLTTIESKEMASKFSLNPDAAVYIDTIEPRAMIRITARGIWRER